MNAAGLQAPRSALVTGAAGFIGSHLLRKLEGAGWRVRGIDVHAAPGSAPRVTRLDLRDAQALRPLLDGVDVVFNLASVHLDVQASVADFEAVNVVAQGALVEACAERGVRRLVHVSSVGVYGHVAAPPATEDTPLNPINTYERSKAAGERAVGAAAARCGQDVVIVRPSWVYGAGCPRTAKLLGALERGRFFYIGRARNLRHPVYIEDVLAGLVRLAVADARVRNRIFNLAGPRWMPLEEMVDSFARALGVPPPRRRIPRAAGLALGWGCERLAALTGREAPISRRTLAFFENDNAFDIGALRQVVGFVPRVGLDEGAAQVVAARSGAESGAVRSSGAAITPANTVRASQPAEIP